MNLKDKCALVTGAGRGIGKGCALELARQGAKLIVNDWPGSPDLEQTVSEVRELGMECLPIGADVFLRKGCQSLVDGALDTVGRIDILVSNPAASLRNDFLEYSPDDFERVLAGTLTSGFHLSQIVTSHMVRRGGGGKVVFISSVHAMMPYARSVAYNAAKAGLNHMARTIATELAEHRINVNVIEPGWIDTPGERATFGEDMVEKAGSQLPWGRLGRPEDIGKAATFLCSEDADYITGAVLRVDGGFTLKDCRGNSATQPPPE